MGKCWSPAPSLSRRVILGGLLWFPWFLEIMHTKCLAQCLALKVSVHSQGGDNDAGVWGRQGQYVTYSSTPSS